MPIIAPASTRDIIRDPLRIENLYLRLYLLLPDDVIADTKKKHEVLNFIEQGSQSMLNPQLLSAFCSRQKEMLSDLRSRGFRTVGPLLMQVASTSRFTCGLANKNLIETGMTLLMPYGIPILPGSALKGSMASWLGDLLTGKLRADSGERLKTIRRTGSDGGLQRLFGWPEDARKDTKGREQQGQSGEAVFFDALLISGGVGVDITTVHYPGWYQGKSIPAGFENPNPLPFLTVKPGSVFQFAIAVEPEARFDANALTDEQRSVLHEFGITDFSVPEKFLEQLLVSTAQYQGFGSQSTAGYGRMEPTKPEQRT